MIRRPPRSTLSSSSAASDVYKRQLLLYTNEKKSISTLKSEKTTFICTLSDYPEEKENSYRLLLKLNRKIEGGKSEPVKGSIMIYNKKDSSAISLSLIHI